MLNLKKALPAAFAIIALSACSSSDDSPAAGKTDNTAPMFDGVVSATASGGTNVDVTWNAANDDVTTGANMRYRIYASLDTADPGLVRDTVTGVTSHKLTFLELASDYFITVEAVDEADNANSNDAQAPVTTGIEVSLAIDLQPTLAATCAITGCHDAATQLHGVNFATADDTYTTLVDVDIHHCGGVGALRVASGGGLTAVANSQIVNVLDWASATPCIENGGTMAIQMPAGVGATEVDHDFLHFFEHWIEDGAPNN